MHVTQYRLLGIDRFTSLYVRGFLTMHLPSCRARLLVPICAPVKSLPGHPLLRILFVYLETVFHFTWTLLSKSLEDALDRGADRHRGIFDPHRHDRGTGRGAVTVSPRLP